MPCKLTQHLLILAALSARLRLKHRHALLPVASGNRTEAGTHLELTGEAPDLRFQISSPRSSRLAVVELLSEGANLLLKSLICGRIALRRQLLLQVHKLSLRGNIVLGFHISYKMVDVDVDNQLPLTP
jgi:hypothetical protein